MKTVSIIFLVIFCYLTYYIYENFINEQIKTVDDFTIIRFTNEVKKSRAALKCMRIFIEKDMENTPLKEKMLGKSTSFFQNFSQLRICDKDKE